MQEDSFWNFGPIEVEIHMGHSDIRRRLDISCTSTTTESRTKIWYQLSAFKATSGLDFCPFEGGCSIVVDFLFIVTPIVRV